MADDLDKFYEDEQLLETLKKIMKRWILEVYTDLQFYTPYTVEDICPDLWPDLNTYEKRMAGRAVAILVHDEELPLEYEGKTPANHRRYTRIR